jgi:hypothetical protein
VALGVRELAALLVGDAGVEEGVGALALAGGDELLGRVVAAIAVPARLLRLGEVGHRGIPLRVARRRRSRRGRRTGRRIGIARGHALLGGAGWLRRRRFRRPTGRRLSSPGRSTTTTPRGERRHHQERLGNQTHQFVPFVLPAACVGAGVLTDAVPTIGCESMS